MQHLCTRLFTEQCFMVEYQLRLSINKAYETNKLLLLT
jgi:hypothetical protein